MAALAGRTIVVTRPAQQAAALAECIVAAGGSVLLFPVIEIADLDDLRGFHAIVDRLEAFDLAIFISPNAVAQAMTLISARRAWPAQLPVATVGRASARLLAAQGVRDIAVPERFDSEALLELPALTAAAGKRIVIFRGVGGRELLGETLVKRGATVEYAECYRRKRPPADAAVLSGAWQRGQLDAVTVTSSEGVRNLVEMLGAGRELLAAVPCFAPHRRIAATAREAGFRCVHETAAGDEGLVAGLIAHFSKASRGKTA
jgi:uroporphyrinogen-III synthase